MGGRQEKEEQSRAEWAPTRLGLRPGVWVPQAVRGSLGPLSGVWPLSGLQPSVAQPILGTHGASLSPCFFFTLQPGLPGPSASSGFDFMVRVSFVHYGGHV